MPRLTIQSWVFVPCEGEEEGSEGRQESYEEPCLGQCVRDRKGRIFIRLSLVKMERRAKKFGAKRVRPERGHKLGSDSVPSSGRMLALKPGESLIAKSFIESLWRGNLGRHQHLGPISRNCPVCCRWPIHSYSAQMEQKAGHALPSVYALSDSRAASPVPTTRGTCVQRLQTR